MGEILGLGVTHFPPLLGLDDNLTSALHNMLSDPGMPEHYRDRANWPASMQAEYGDDKGRSAAAGHRAEVLDGLRKARAALDEFNPDVVVIWGDDQYENFREDVIPAFCVEAYDDVEIRPWANRKNPNIWDEPADTVISVKGAPTVGRALVEGLLAEGFDTAYSYKPLHYEGLTHAFLNSVLYLDYDRQGFPYPVLPIQVNCYGRFVISHKGWYPDLTQPLDNEHLDPPSPQPWRCFDFGAACARVFSQMDLRVALVASASWSHGFLTRRHNFLYPDNDADQHLYEALRAGDYDVWRNTPLDEIEMSGQHELLNWMCVIGAMAELGRKPDFTAMTFTQIFNSDKCVAIFKP